MHLALELQDARGPSPPEGPAPFLRDATQRLPRFYAILSRSEVRWEAAVADAPKSFTEFWPIYVRAHSQAGTRLLHFAGTLLGWTLLVGAAVWRNPWLVPVALVVGYGFAWIGHFFVEHNKPATFGYPGWSWLADQKMVLLMLSGKMDDEVRRCVGQRTP